MVRTQVQLTEAQMRTLKRLSAQQGVSVAELIRQSVELFARSRGAGDDQTQRQRALSVVGRFHSGRRDLAAEHDRYLSEACQP